MKNKRFLAVLALGALATSCSPDNDSILVVSVDGPSTIPAFYYLQVVLTNGGMNDYRQFPTNGEGTPITLPTSLGFNLPRSRSGTIDLTFDALNLQMQSVASGTGTVQLNVGDRTDLCVGLALSGVSCQGTSIDGGVTSSDAGLPKSEVAARDDAAVTPDGGFPAGLQLSHVAAGAEHTCAVGSTGDLWCWGDNSTGAIGNGNTIDALLPAHLTGTAWKDVTAGYGETCALQGTGDLWCWGNNGSGQLGGGFARANSPITIPLQVLPGSAWAMASAGEYHVAAVQSDGSLWTWGDNTSDQLGDSIAPSAGRSSPATVGSAQWLTVAAGSLHNCGIQADQSLWCWGNNASGQLGDKTVRMHADPTQSEGTGWTSLTAGLYHTCGTKIDGTLWCWGSNVNGQLGLVAATSTSLLTPTQVPPVGPWLSVSAGQNHTCGLQADFSLWCWGSNADGQLGIGSNAAATAPALVAPGSTWASVSCGGSHTCGIASDGRLWCWGKNDHGQLGVAGTASRTTPTRLGS